MRHVPRWPASCLMKIGRTKPGFACGPRVRRGIRVKGSRGSVEERWKSELSGDFERPVRWPQLLLERGAQGPRGLGYKYRISLPGGEAGRSRTLFLQDARQRLISAKPQVPCRGLPLLPWMDFLLWISIFLFVQMPFWADMKHNFQATLLCCNIGRLICSALRLEMPCAVLAPSNRLTNASAGPRGLALQSPSKFSFSVFWASFHAVPAHGTLYFVTMQNTDSSLRAL
jgi:hypothetical protein